MRVCSGRKVGCLSTERMEPQGLEISERRDLGKHLDWRQAGAEPCQAWCWIVSREHREAAAKFRVAG